MESTPTTLNRVSTVLRKEYELARVSKAQEILFWALEVVVYGLPLLIAGFLGASALPESVFGEVRLLLLTPINPLIVLLVLLLAANVPLIRKAWLQVRLARKVRALDLAESLWRPEHPRRDRWGWIALRFAAPAVLLSMLFVTLVARGGLGSVGVAGVAGVLLVCAGLPAVLLPFDRMLDRLRSRLDYFHEVSSVRRGLESTGPVADREQIESRTAAIDTTRILRRRALAIRSAERHKTLGYSLAKSADFNAASHRLEIPERLQVEDTIEDLSSDPQPEAATEVSAGKWSLLVPGTDLVLLYAIVEPQRRIEVLSLKPAGDLP